MGDNSHSVSASDSRLIAIGIQFRMKGVAKGDPRTIKQLRVDGETLMSQHPTQVCCTDVADGVKLASDLLFRTFNITEKGHAMAGS